MSGVNAVRLVRLRLVPKPCCHAASRLASLRYLRVSERLKRVFAQREISDKKVDHRGRNHFFICCVAIMFFDFERFQHCC